jgi:putative membrane protein
MMLLHVFLTQITYPTATLAHEGPIYPHDAWVSWNGQPLIVVALALAVSAYASGLSRAWRQAGVGRGISPWQAVSFGVGALALALALISPLDAISSALFSAHMAQHTLLITLAAPLLVLGAPHLALLWAVPRHMRHRLGRWFNRRAWQSARSVLSQPLLVWALFVGVLWIWHLPRLYQTALAREAVHTFEHVSLVAAATTFWWMIARLRRNGRSGHGLAILYIFVAALQGGVLGALIAFSRTPWYEWYAQSSSWWGLAPIEDQQLAGLIMWIPGGFIYLIAALALLADWLMAGERQASRRETKDGGRRTKEGNLRPQY